MTQVAQQTTQAEAERAAPARESESRTKSKTARRASAIRSYVLRKGRLSPAQARSLQQHWRRYGLSADVALNARQAFGRAAPLRMEIGFGNGEHLLRAAMDAPQDNFIGVEVWPPGIGTLLRRVAEERLDNVRVVQGDAAEYVRFRLPAACLDTVWILFPDPWPKKRHHKRRLIGATFLDELADKMKSGAVAYLATDWRHYALEMREAARRCEGFEPIDGGDETNARHTPTRFEMRGARAGRDIFNLTLKCL